jgi:signal transduction histidine kinase
VDLGELLDGLARTTLPPGVAARVERNGGTAPMVLGHYEPLRRAFQNLLLNAVDAVGATAAGDGGGGARGGSAVADPIVLSLAPSSLQGRPAVRVAIADRGPGIAAESLGRVFEPYFTTKTHGTGLGLAIVRQTVLDHGGTITAANAPGGGAIFTVTLPAEGA